MIVQFRRGPLCRRPLALCFFCNHIVFLQLGVQSVFLLPAQNAGVELIFGLGAVETIF